MAEESSRDEEETSFQVPLVWVGAEDVPILFSNQALVQFSADTPDEFVISLGQVAPPILLGTPEQRKQQARGIPWIEVKTVVRVSMTRARAEALAHVLTEILTNYDRQQEGK